MAKAQGISLNPSEITGMCGRLRCCLVYEYEQYLEAKKHLPKLGKQIGTPHGPGKVIALNPLAETVTVLVEETRYDLHREELVPLEQLQALKDKAGLGCTKEGSGPCECGARIRGAPAEDPGQPVPPPAASSQPWKIRHLQVESRRSDAPRQERRHPQSSRPQTAPPAAQETGGESASSDKARARRRKRGRRRGPQSPPASGGNP
jgi:hypothetical protein